MKNRTARILTIWSLTLVILHIGLLCLYQKVIMGNTIQNQKERYFNQHPKKANVWVFGDSHPLLAFDPQWFPGSFNWAGTSENYVLNYFKIKDLISKGLKPDKIIISAEYHGLSTQGMALLKNHELDDSYWVYKISSRELAANQPNGSDFYRWKISATGATYAGQFYNLISYLDRHETRISSQGYLASVEVFETSHEKGKVLFSKIKSHTSYPMIDPIQIIYLKKIKNLCSREGISLVFVRYPIHPDYYRLLKEATNTRSIDSTYQTILNKEVVLDFRFRFDENLNYFSDPDHLNSNGAKVFTKILADTIRN